MIKVQNVIKKYSQYEKAQKLLGIKNTKPELTDAQKLREHLELSEIRITAQDIVLNTFSYSFD